MEGTAAPKAAARGSSRSAPPQGPAPKASPGKPRQCPFFVVIIGPKRDEYDHDRAFVSVNNEPLTLDRGVEIPLERKYVEALFNGRYPVFKTDKTAPGGRKKAGTSRHFPFTIVRRIYDEEEFRKLKAAAMDTRVHRAQLDEAADMILDADDGAHEAGEPGLDD